MSQKKQQTKPADASKRSQDRCAVIIAAMDKAPDLATEVRIARRMLLD